MKRTIMVACLLSAAAAFAQPSEGIQKVLQAEQAAEQAKAHAKAIKATLSKREKAELAVLQAQRKLAKLED